MPWLFVVLLFLCPSLGNIQAAEITVAVASNFSKPLRAVAKKFEAESGHKVYISVGSSGRHFAQIKNGAPYDVFLSADAERPILLEQQNVAVAESRFTYAFGRVVLWSPDKTLVDNQGLVLRNPRFEHIAMANPRLAPYGRSAKQIIDAMGLWDSLSPLIVQGENIAQTFQFVESGNAELGFVAWSQIKHISVAQQGSYWQVPESLYSPIEQQAVLLTSKPAALEFVDYLKSDAVRLIIHEAGYNTP